MPEGRIDVMGVSDAEAPPRLPELGAVGALRWVWRQLTSMRVALMLLMLLAVVAVPGSVLPQRPQDPAKVATYLADNPGLGPWLDRLGLFDVYASVWFSAVYLLLFVSLIGCIVPRVAMHGRALRARPPRAPRRFDRFGVRGRAVVDAPAAEVLAVATRTLAGPVRALPRFRVDTGPASVRVATASTSAAGASTTARPRTPNRSKRRGARGGRARSARPCMATRGTMQPIRETNSSRYTAENHTDA